MVVVMGGGWFKVGGYDGVVMDGVWVQGGGMMVMI